MSQFIVISTNKKLSELVDGIQNCRPLNTNVQTLISTGKIEEEEEQCFYEYQISGDKPAQMHDKLENMILQQTSDFRAMIGNGNPLNIFTLESPTTEKEFNRITDAFYVLINDNNQPTILNNIHIYRILLPFNVEDPHNVTEKINADLFNGFVVSNKMIENYSSLVIIDNRDKIGATVFKNKQDYKLILPRMLCDIMMLASSQNAGNNVVNALNNVNNLGGVCVLGFAESMYYFDDVKQYIEHADMLLLYQHILNDPDQTETLENDQDALDYEKYPLGLIKRAERLKKYDDVPFTEDINKHQDTVDYTIDACLKHLHNAFKENIKQDIQENSLPKFFTRSAGPCVNEAEETKTRDNYHKLIDYITSNDFSMFIDEQFGDANKESSTTSTAQPINTTTTPTTKNNGCWGKFISFFKRNDPPANITQPVEKTKTPLDYLKEIKEQQQLKNLYKKLLAKIDKIKAQIKEEQDWCDKFELTDHSHHFFHLIDLQKLKDFHKKGFDERYNTFKDKAKSMTHLDNLMAEDTKKYTKQFEFINWTDPFEFVKDVNDSRKVSDDKFAEIINNLTRESTPFIHYNEITQHAQNNITIHLYSDIPNINQRFNDVKNNVSKGNLIIPYNSTHTASKICIFQFLPLPQNILISLFENVTLYDDISSP